MHNILILINFTSNEKQKASSYCVMNTIKNHFGGDFVKILVLNSGSSSLKYQVIDMETEEMLVKGYFERIGQPNSFLTH